MVEECVCTVRHIQMVVTFDPVMNRFLFKVISLASIQLTPDNGEPFNGTQVGQ